MNSSPSDTELGQTLRAKAASLGYTPDALLALAEAAADFQRWSILPNFAPFPQLTAEQIIGPEHLDGWPDWSEKIIPRGSQLESLLWPDGTITVRLVSPHGLVLASSIERPSTPA